MQVEGHTSQHDPLRDHAGSVDEEDGAEPGHKAVHAHLNGLAVRENAGACKNDATCTTTFDFSCC